MKRFLICRSAKKRLVEKSTASLSRYANRFRFLLEPDQRGARWITRVRRSTDVRDLRVAVPINSGRSINESLLTRMRDTMVHRGPDDAGLFMDRQAGLGHRRLSIVDLAGGHQPMSNEDRMIWISYNGEIYNHRELRPLLERQGHTYQTECDTETIIHLYEDQGAGAVKHLRGMFAFAIWDSGRGRLLLCRDRLGIKPLY